MDAVISYPGAKWRFYPHIKQYIPRDMETWIEPFFGGGSMTLSVAEDPDFSNVQRMIVGDLAPEVYTFWKVVKEQPDELVQGTMAKLNEVCPHQHYLRELGLTGSVVKAYNENRELDENKRELVRENLDLYNTAKDEGHELWKWIKGADTSQMTDLDRAIRFMLSNRTSFSGLGDSGSISMDNFAMFCEKLLHPVYAGSELLKRVEIYNVSFEDTMKYAYDKPESTFIFLDPPYAAQEGFGLYGRNGDTHRGFNHQHFADYTRTMPCKWFVTYDDSPITRRLFYGSDTNGNQIYETPFKIPGGYTMAMKASEDALAGEELFITNYDINSLDEELDF